MLEFFQPRFPNRNPEKQREEERRRHRKQKRKQHAGDNRKGQLLPACDLQFRIVRRHLDGLQLLRNQKLDQIGKSAVGQPEVHVGDHGDRHKEMRRQLQRGEEHHRPVRAADQCDRGRVLEVVPEQTGQRQNQQRPQLRKQRDDGRHIRPLHYEADVQERADADEDQTGDEPVAEGQRVDRLQPVDLHQRHQMVVVADRGVEEEVVHGGFIHRRLVRHVDRVKEHRGDVDRRHAQPHGDHQQRFQNAFAPQPDQGEAEQHQNKPDRDHHRIRGEHDGKSLKQIEKTIHDSPPVSPESRRGARRTAPALPPRPPASPARLLPER